MKKYQNSLAFAKKMDKEDELRKYRRQYHLPKQKNGKPFIYLCGNSLGLQPKQTRNHVEQELLDWEKLGVEGHFHAKTPWMPYHEFLTKAMAKVVGAKPKEVGRMIAVRARSNFIIRYFGAQSKILCDDM